MKALVLNLERRQDRKELFDETNGDKLSYQYSEYTWDGNDLKYEKLRELGFNTDKSWIDPIEETHLTKGEVGCFLSHWYAWRYCIEYNEPLLILEDDAIITDRFDEDQIHTKLNEGYNFVYLGWREMGESTAPTPPLNTVIDLSSNPMMAMAMMGAVQSQNTDVASKVLDSVQNTITTSDEFVTPDYPYWTVGYVITPQSAQVLLNDTAKKNIIPVDEYLAKKIKELNPIAYKENVVEQRDRGEVGTDVTTGSRYDAFIDFDIHPLTMGTDEDKCARLFASAQTHGFEFTNLGKNVEWIGGDMLRSLGGGQKLRAVSEYIKELPDEDVVFFCDAYDVFMVDSVNEMVYRYLEIGHKVLFGAERICWPDASLSDTHKKINRKHFPNLDTPYQHLNSGTFIGRVGELKRILSILPDADESDQLWMQKRFFSGEFDIALDTECYLFQQHEPEVYKDGDQLLNPITCVYTCLYHGNGGVNEKELFVRKYKDFYGMESPLVYIPTVDYEVLDDDIIMIDYLTPSMCDALIELSEANGGYKGLEGDDVPAQEIRLSVLGVRDVTAAHWWDYVAPVMGKHWECCTYRGLRDAFIIKYSMNGQKHLRLHSDISLITGSVKLNDDYEGGELYFPRQNFSNKDVPVGKCILFPGQVTHPHTSKELKSGTKFSLTMWSNGNAFVD